MKKLIISGGIALAAAGAFAVSFAFAQTATLTASCTGTVSSTVVNWSASATGGNAPYAYAWSGDASVAGATSSQVAATYNATGTYAATVLITDASSSTSTANCSAVVTVLPAPTSTTPTPTSTPVVSTPRVNPPMLTINPGGRFLSRGMIVTSVGTNSFQAQVWGITYTVNFSGSVNNSFEFWLRFHAANSTSTPQNQLKVGDEVGVSGSIDPSAPLVVNADVVRDYSVITPREDGFGNQEGQGNPGGDNGLGNGGENHGQGNAFGTLGNLFNVSSSVNASGSLRTELQDRLEQLLSQFQNLQGLLHGHGGDQGNGNQGGNGANASGSDH